jgi:hypothetical protein
VSAGQNVGLSAYIGVPGNLSLAWISIVPQSIN